MYWHIKFISLFSLVTMTLSGLMTTSLLNIWVFLELSTLSFIAYFSVDVFLKYYKEIMKLFFIQALSGMVLIITFVSSKTNQDLILNTLLFMILLFKMGSIPFHGWLMKLTKSMSWGCLFIFLTLSKILPLHFLSTLALSGLPLMCSLIFLFCSFLALLSANLKQMIIISSLFFLGMMFLIMKKAMDWLELLLIYSVMLFPLTLLSNTSNNDHSLFSTFSLNAFSGLIFFIFLMNLAGVPPFAGFFLKYLWLFSTDFNIIFINFFFFTSAFMAFMYLSYAFKSLTWLTGSMFDSSKSFMLSWVLVLGLSLIMVLI